MEQSALLQEIKHIVRRHDPEATVILYGSRARGDADEESDWDLLVLSDPLSEAAERERLRRDLYQLEWSSGEVLCASVQKRSVWNSPIMMASPFRKNVEREGLTL